MAYTALSDEVWLSRSFRVPNSKAAEALIAYGRKSTGRIKFSDTSIGGHSSINVPYQANPNSDIRCKRAYSSAVGFGMGRWFSENIDDNKVEAHFRVGVVAHNSILSFYRSYFVYSHSVFSRTGRVPGFLYTIGRIIGVALNFIYLDIVLILAAFNFLDSAGHSGYWYIKPAAHILWNAVNSMANTICANLGLTGAPGLSPLTVRTGKEPIKAEYDNLIKNIRRNMGDVWVTPISEDVGFQIDAWAVANRYTRMANKVESQYQQILSKVTSDDELVDTILYKDIGKTVVDNVAKEQSGNFGYPNSKGFASYLQTASKTSGYSEQIEENQKGAAFGENPGTATVEDPDSVSTLTPSIGEIFKTEMDEGSAYLSFIINGNETVTESFNNTAEEGQAKGMLSGLSNTIRSTKYNLMGGQHGIPVLQDVQNFLLNGMKDIIGSVADSFNISGILGAFYGTYPDIPKQWGGSSANLPSVSLSWKFRTPYGNKLAIFQDVIFPTLVVLGMALPIAEGMHSYTSPLMTEVYVKGKHTIKLGMFESLTVKRGEGNVGWSVDGLPLGIDIDATVVDLNDIMALQVNGGGWLNQALDTVTVSKVVDNLLIGEGSAMSYYLSTLSGLEFGDMVYASKNIRKNWLKFTTDVKSLTSPHRIIGSMMSNRAGEIIKAFGGFSPRT